MRKTLIMLFALAALLGCQWEMNRSAERGHDKVEVAIDRFDRAESQYLTLGDITALHQMQTDYPQQTRTLIENVLVLGPANTPDINLRLLAYFSDTTLQTIMADVERQYADMSDLNRQLTEAFQRLLQLMPGIGVPHVYAQIGSLDQSIIVTDSLVGISLDKYLGADYPVYLRFDYSERQLNMMTRKCIVPDCLLYYLLSRYPLSDYAQASAEQRRLHMAKIQCVVNQALGQKFFTGELTDRLEAYRNSHPHLSVADFLMLESI